MYDPSIKCVVIDSPCVNICKSKAPTYCLLDKHNNFITFSADGTIDSTAETDVIRLSQSGRNIKVMSDPSTVKLNLVPVDGWESKLWSAAPRAKQCPIVYFPNITAIILFEIQQSLNHLSFYVFPVFLTYIPSNYAYHNERAALSNRLNLSGPERLNRTTLFSISMKYS